MQSAVAESRREVFTDDLWNVTMTTVMRRNELFGVDRVLPKHVCEAESGCVYQRKRQMVPDTQTAK